MGFIGESGEGKSMVTHLIEMFYAPSEGNVLIDDVNVKERFVTMRQCGVCSAGSALFSRSEFENIQHGNLDAGDEEVKEVARKCKVL